MKKYTIDKDENIESAIQKILYNQHRTILVLDRKKVVGTISEGDILKSIIYKKKFNAKLVSIMNKNFKYLEYKKYSTKDIHNLFAKHLCGLIPIIDKKMNLKDVISLEDFRDGLLSGRAAYQSDLEKLAAAQPNNQQVQDYAYGGRQ